MAEEAGLGLEALAASECKAGTGVLSAGEQQPPARPPASEAPVRFIIWVCQRQEVIGISKDFFHRLGVPCR